MRTVILAGLALLCAACASTIELGEGRIAKLEVVETRSPFGTNVVVYRLRDCREHKNLRYPLQESTYSGCESIPVNGQEWNTGSSQGQGGQVAQGFLQIPAMATLGLLMPAGSGVLQQGQSLIVTTPAHKGYH